MNTTNTIDSTLPTSLFSLPPINKVDRASALCLKTIENSQKAFETGASCTQRFDTKAMQGALNKLQEAIAERKVAIETILLQSASPINPIEGQTYEELKMFLDKASEMLKNDGIAFTSAADRYDTFFLKGAALWLAGLGLCLTGDVLFVTALVGMCSAACLPLGLTLLAVGLLCIILAMGTDRDNYEAATAAELRLKHDLESFGGDFQGHINRLFEVRLNKQDAVLADVMKTLWERAVNN